jgi:hypothetical protein
MKPLPVALLTPDDARIWLRVAASIDPEYETTPASSARKADRRDAELMWRAMWPCPACGRQTRNTFAYQVDWLWRRCRCGNIWAIEPRQGFNVLMSNVS